MESTGNPAAKGRARERGEPGRKDAVGTRERMPNDRTGRCGKGSGRLSGIARTKGCGKGAGGLSVFFARRLLFSPKSHSVINIVSRVSMVAVGIPLAAMVILMAVFSGFEGMIREMYGNFDPDIAVMPAQGKVFDPARVDASTIGKLEGVAGVSFVLEESALVEYHGRQTTLTVRGVDSLYRHIVPLDKMMYAGRTDAGGVVVGQGIAYKLGGVMVGVDDSLWFYVPRRGSYSALLPMNAFSWGGTPIEGVFALDADTDGQYVITTLDFARRLFEYPSRASALLVRAKEGTDVKKLQTRIATIVGDEFKPLTRYEQKASMYKIMTLEKWGIFFIGLLVLVIASFSIVGSLIMLIIDKRADINTLYSMGASTRLVRRVFTWQGAMIGTIGAVGGLVAGVAVCAVQQIFGVIPMPGSTFLIDSYPVSMRAGDIAVICGAFIAVNYIIVTFTVLKTIAKHDL